MAATLGYSRAYYKREKEKGRPHRTGTVGRAAKRKVLPRVGTRKLHRMIGRELRAKGLTCVRDKLFGILGQKGIPIAPKRRYVQATDGRHWLHRYPNIAKDLVVDGPEQLWALEGNCYLNLVTDAYSGKIVGHAVRDNMGAESMVGAYRDAIAVKTCPGVQTVHHSDRGCSSAAGNM